MDAANYSNTASPALGEYDQAVEGTETSADDVVAAGADGIALAVALGALSIFGAVGNCLTILAVVTNRQLRSQTSSYLIVNLAVADMVVFVIIEPFLSFSAATTTWPFSIPLCATLAVLITQHMITSVCSMAAIAVNRFYSVTRHQRYRQTFTRRRTLVLCLATWVPGLALILSVIFTPFFAGYRSYYGVCIIVSLDTGAARATSVLTALTILISIVISSLCYLHIYRTVRESRRRVKPTGPPAGGEVDGNPGIHIAEALSPTEENSMPVMRNPNAKQHPVNRTDIAISLNLFIVFAVFCVCWAPLTVLIFVQNVTGMNFRDELQYTTPSWTWQAAYKMVLFNSTLNIFIYAWKNRNFRSAYRALLKCQNS